MPEVIVKDQSSHLVYLNICIKWQTCENLNSIGCRSCKRIMEEKNVLVAQVVCFQMLYFDTPKSKFKVPKPKFKYLSEKFWKLRYFRGSCFSQYFVLSAALHYLLPSRVLDTIGNHSNSLHHVTLYISVITSQITKILFHHLFQAEFGQALRMLQEQYKKLSTIQHIEGNQVSSCVVIVVM